MHTLGSVGREQRRGLTLVEIVMSISLGALVVSSALQVVVRGTAVSDTASTGGELEEDLRRALDLATDSLRAARASSGIVEDSSAGAPAGRLVFETLAFADDAAPTTSENWIEVVPQPGEPWNGRDDDGDGLVDEGRLVLVRDPGLMGERRITLCDGIPRAGDGELPGDDIDQDGDGLIDERGVEIVVEERGVLLRLSAEARTRDGEVLRHAAQRWIRQRN